jgi:hypothetical protein
VEVRIGNHPTFTRVVCELDAPAGYRIERRTAEEGASEILVTLEASSTPRSVMSHSAMVERVAVQDGRARSVAHIRLKKSPSRVKELILSNPPRIVFDLMFPEKELIAAKLAAARKAQAEAEAQAEKKPKAEEKTPAAEPKKLAATPKPTPKPSAAPKAPEPEAEPASTAKPSPLPPREAEPAPKVAPKAPPAAEIPKLVVMPEPEKPEALAQTEPLKPAVKPLPPKPEPKKAVAKKPAAAPPPKPVPAAGGGIDWVTWGGVAAGVLVVLLVIVLVLRRRALPNDLDVTALAEEESDEGAFLDGGFAMGEQAAPKSMGAMGEQAEPAPQEPIAPHTRIPEQESPPGAPNIAAGPGLFDDEPEKENETMDIETPGMPIERTASELPTQIGAGAAGESDTARLVQELERRVAQLETRLDEFVDMRERLERQVAAQSEELRVQRAAIARTQRALRSLNRGEDEHATEPALREPSS